MISVSVIVTTRNEAANIERCLAALSDFSEIIVVDSNSDDDTQKLAADSGAKIIPYQWDGKYPKKRQWCLDNLELKHDWVFFVDADEIITEELVKELKTCPLKCAGYFVKGRYVIEEKALRFGLKNNKLCLIDRRKVMFPVIDDLDIPGMGEIEGHYQPVLRPEFEHEKIGALKQTLLHYAYDENWNERHGRYATWEAAMNRKQAWPQDPLAWRQILKRIFRAIPGRGLIAFVHCYILKYGFLDGHTGLNFARSRYRYYRMIDKNKQC